MAIDLCSETSPRISFSHDLGQTDVVPIDYHSKSRLDSSLLDSNYDFEFGIHEHEFSSADELFSGGVILPIQIRERTANPKRAHDSLTQPLLSLPPRPAGTSSNSGNSKKESLKEMAVANSDSEEKTQSKSFWSFKRSTSLNCNNGSKKSLLSSLPLLSRSNSTGSVPNPKRTTMSSSKDAKKQNSHRVPSMAKSASSTTTTASSFYTYQMQQKGQLKKNHAGPYGHGGQISPVLNVPPPYISKSTANLFGLGSFFSNGKDKKHRR